VALERCLAVAETANGPVHELPELWSDKGIRFNDGGCSPGGTLYGGTMAYDGGKGRATLYRFDQGLRPASVVDGVTVSNGLAWSPDGSLAYYNDSPTGQVDVFDDEDDRLLRRRPFTTVEGGLPDGLSVDAEGGVWVAVWGGGAVHRYSPDGRLSEVVELPVRQVSACTFGGDGLDTLFITTSRENLPDGAEPEAGSVYAVEPGVRGQPVTPWAG
jgi:sugar lactone lactonase YvrE